MNLSASCSNNLGNEQIIPGVNFLITIVSKLFINPAVGSIETVLTSVPDSRNALMVDACAFVTRPVFFKSPFKNSRCLSIAFCNFSNSLSDNPDCDSESVASLSSASSSLSDSESSNSPSPELLPLPSPPPPPCHLPWPSAPGWVISESASSSSACLACSAVAVAVSIIL